MPVSGLVHGLKAGLRSRQQQGDQVDILMRGGAYGARLRGFHRRVMKDSQKALVASFHHLVKRHRQAVGDLGRGLALDPAKKLTPQILQIGVDLAGHRLDIGGKRTPRIDMKELLQVLYRRILRIFRTKGEIAVMRRRRHGEIELVLAGKESAPGLVDGVDPVGRDRVVCQHGKAGVTKRARQCFGGFRCPVVNGFDFHPALSLNMLSPAIEGHAAGGGGIGAAGNLDEVLARGGAVHSHRNLHRSPSFGTRHGASDVLTLTDYRDWRCLKTE